MCMSTLANASVVPFLMMMTARQRCIADADIPSGVVQLHTYVYSIQVGDGSERQGEQGRKGCAGCRRRWYYFTTTNRTDRAKIW